MSSTHDAPRTLEGRFAPGQSGNPAGRPKGSRNKATLIAEALLDDATGPVVATAIENALAGDGSMLRTVFQAICKKDPGRTIELDLPEGSFGDPVAFLEATMRAVALGEITPQEAALLARVASVMVQAQRVKLRIEQLKGRARPVVAGLDPATHVGRSGQGARGSSDGSAARVDGRVKPGHDVVCENGEPVSRLYSGSHPVAASVATVFSREARSSIPPVNRDDERRKAA
jgi:hypothetical protein